MHLLAHQHALRNSNGERLDDVVERIRSQNPEVFHSEHSLKTRVFFDEPARPLESAGFIKAHNPTERRWVRVGAALPPS